MSDGIEVEAAEPPSDAQLKSVAQLAARRAELEALVATREQSLKDAQAALRECEERDLPDAMITVGLTEFSLLDGSKLVLKSATMGAISEEHRPAAFAWLRENGSGDLIKSNILVGLQKEHGEFVKPIVDWLRALPIGNNLSLEVKEGVHAGSLQAWIRRRAEGGALPPADIFGIFVRRWVDVKKPKRSKSDDEL